MTSSLRTGENVTMNACTVSLSLISSPSVMISFSSSKASNDFPSVVRTSRHLCVHTGLATKTTDRQVVKGAFLIQRSFNCLELTCLEKQHHFQTVAVSNAAYWEQTPDENHWEDLIGTDYLFPLIHKGELYCHMAMVTEQNCRSWEHV